MPPVLPTERIAHLATAGDYCAAGFRSDLCRRRVMSAPDDPGDPAAYVRFAPIATELPCRSNPPLRARSGCEQSQQIASLFDHLVGSYEQAGRYRQAQRFRRPEIDNGF